MPDKTALVTGAAARIGAEIARRLHRRGCHIVLHFNASAEAATQLADELNDRRPRSVTLVSADLSRAAGVESLATATSAVSEGLDVLVNNASRFYATSLGKTHQYQWDDVMDSNLRAPYFLVQALLPQLKVAGGAVINIIDIHARQPMVGHGLYSISKAGLEMLTKALALELAPDVRVNGVSPGAILWPENQAPPVAFAKARQRILQRVAMGRTGTPTDVASTVEFLALDSPYITGQIVAVDGGRSLNM